MAICLGIYPTFSDKPKSARTSPCADGAGAAGAAGACASTCLGDGWLSRTKNGWTSWFKRGYEFFERVPKDSSLEWCFFLMFSGLTSGKLRVCYGKLQLLKGKSTISMAMASIANR